jgi:hypothetical protein
MITVCVLEGNIKERKGILSKIKESLADYELCTFDNDDFYDQVSQQVTELSCFGQRRLFIIRALPQIRGAGKSKDAKSKARTKVMNDFKKLFPFIPVGNLVVFNNVGISAPSFFKEVEKFGKVYKFKQKISKADAIKIVFSYFSKHQIDIEHEISTLIVDSLNIMGNDVDVDKLLLLLLKMYHYVYDKKSVTKKDVFAICSMSEDFIIWSLYKIFDGDGEDNRYSRSFKMANDFLINSRYFHFESTRLMQSMLWRYGLLLMGKSGVELKISKKEIAAEIANIKKLKSKGKAQKIILSQKDDKLEYSNKMVNNVLLRRYGKETLSCYTLDELLSIYHTISKALVKVRTGCTSSEMTTLLQIIFLTICGELNCKTSSSGILEPKKMLKEGV